MSTPDNGLSAVLLKITEHAERLAQLDATLTAHMAENQAELAGITGAITDLRALAQEQAGLVASLNEVVTSMLETAADEPAKGYTPRPPVQWWKLTEAQRAKEVAHLAAWVDQVFRPWYGHLAEMLGTCWQEHPLCLLGLEIVSELHSVLTFQPKRSASLLSAQAEFATRILPAFAEQWRTETTKCEHHATASSSPWRGAR